MKKYLPIILILSIVKLTIQLLGNGNYGFHRDELLHLSVSEHLDWGFMEFPPFIAFLGKISYWLFDHSLMGMRLFPTLAGVVILILGCLIAKEFGGKSKAILLSGICILAFLPFYRNHTLFQPVAFNQLFWTLGFYGIVRFINSQDKKYLILLGITIGIGLMNKYLMGIWVFGALVGFMFHKNGGAYKNKWLYISALISLLIFLPNIIWQVQNDLPLLKHMQALKDNQLSEMKPMDFGLDQLVSPFTLLVSLIGLWAIMAGKILKKYRAIGVAVLVIFCSLWLLGTKTYYVFGIYPVLFAAGAVKIEFLLSKKPAWVYAVAAIVLIPSIPFIPEATPILPIEKFVDYTGKKEVNGRIELTGDYADMFGWEEQVRLVDSVYHALSEKERKNCVIWAENYGEAGAVQILGDQYGLPNPISRHGSFWLWGYGNKDASVWISIGNEKSSVEHIFKDVKLIKTITHKYAIGEENEIPLYICRNPKVDIEAWWKSYKEHVFD